MRSPLVSIVIGTFNRLRFLQATIETVRHDAGGIANEIIVVDGGSSDGTLDWLGRQSDIVAVVQHNRFKSNGLLVARHSWGHFMNLGFRIASGAYVCMLSDDCLVVPGAIPNGIRSFQDAVALGRTPGAAAFYWRNWPVQQDWVVGVTWGNQLFVNHGLYWRDALKAVGYIDEDAFAFYHADGDVCLRMAQAGYPTIPASRSFIEHFLGSDGEIRAANLRRQREDWATYQARWEHLGAPTRDWLEQTFRDEAGTAERYWSRDRGRGWSLASRTAKTTRRAREIATQVGRRLRIR